MQKVKKSQSVRGAAIALAPELRRARDAIAQGMASDRSRLFHLYRQWAAAPQNEAKQKQFADYLSASLQKREHRKAQLPNPTLAEELPITNHAEDIIKAIREHQVVVIAGETGSGKTTQIPKLALMAGRGEAGQIGCTQPRRLAARSVAGRVAAELQTELGGQVGFQVRSQDLVSDRTVIKFMTDGILLAEIQGDKWLSKYDTLIIDEAHERSLNIDFLLGYLRLLLQKRKDLKVIVTSATIDTERFSKHFGDAPVIQVEGRTYPVEVRYRPLETAENGEAIGALQGLVNAIDELTQEDPRGDVLVFLPGEREIREAHQVLEKKRYRHTEVLPLYARLSSKDQDRIFNPNPQRRIVLATNVAETSITVPRIRYVVDPGVARIKRYSPRAKIDRLQIEPVSQASANQRMGRCGRLSEGVCIRLYSQHDFEQRPEFTDPEIRRAALAGVILRMLALGLGEIERFPFLEMPDPRAITDGWQELLELNAIDEQRHLTPIGRSMVLWPVDVKLARMLTASKERGVTREMLTIAAFLGVQDPRERPADRRAEADRAHAEFADPRSEFVGILNLWRAYQQAHEELSSSKLRSWCQKHFVGFLRMREWRDLHRQLKVQMDAQKWPLNDDHETLEPTQYAQLHRALITGIPTQVGHRNEKGGLDGPRGRKYLIFPGSPLAKKPPAWLLSAQILETEKVWGLTNAAIEPEWVIEAVPHLLARKHFNPRWSRSQGRVLGSEQISLFGLVLAPQKPIHYGGLYPQEARELFVRDALLTFEIDTRSSFLAHNLKTLDQAREEEAKQRRTGLVVDEDWMARWYLDRLPPNVHNVQALDQWTRKQSPEERRKLQWSLTDLLIADPANAERFPPYWPLGDARLGVRYQFEPGAADDGMNIKVPLHLLNALDPSRLSWLAPGLVEGKAAALIKTLPKPLRRHVVPAPDFAKAFAQAYGVWNHGLPPSADSMAGALAKFLSKVAGEAIATTDFDEAALESNWRANLQLTDSKGKQVLAQSRDLDALKSRYGEQAAQAFAAQATANLRQQELTEFPVEPLPLQVRAAGGVPGFVALRDDGDHVSVQVLADREQAQTLHTQGVERLLRLHLRDAIKQARKQLPLNPKAALQYTAIEQRDIHALREELVEGALSDLLATSDLSVRDRAAFEMQLKQVSKELFREAMQRWQLADTVLAATAQVRAQLDTKLMGWASGNMDDLRKHLETLTSKGFLSRVPITQLREYPRYLKAMRLRAERAKDNPQRDQQRLLELKPFVDALTKADLSQLSWQEFGWDLEELRVQTFAQELGTKRQVSVKKLAHRLQQLLR